MERRDYNTINGITRSLVSLTDFEQLLDEREKANKIRKEKLHRFIVLGRLVLDEIGNVGDNLSASWSDGRPIIEEFPSIPPVLTEERFQARYAERYSYSSPARIPPADKICPECKEGWTIGNFYDSFLRFNDECKLLESYVGLNLAQVNQEFDKSREGSRFLHPELHIRNDQWIDLTPRQDHPELPINERGWKDTYRGINKDYVVQKGDEALVCEWIYRHKPCNRLFTERRARKSFMDIYEQAGFDQRTLVFESVPNEYCSCEQCAPWFDVVTSFGTMKIGYRKRVILMDWSNTGWDIAELFNKEQVTKGPGYIHAWGSDQATEFLQRIRQSI